MLEALPAAPGAAPAGGPGRDLPAGVGTAALTEALWDVARRTRLRPLVEAYLDHDPDGPHATEARRLLALLPSPAVEAATPARRCDVLATHVNDGTADVDGVPLYQLARNARAAREACASAAAAHPDLPRYTALLARASYAAGDVPEAARLYRDAADRGDLRAMYSLARMIESGDGLPRDPPAALALYERAAAAGHADSATNLARALLRGEGTAPDPARARRLLEQAAAQGSGAATRNLGLLALKEGDPAAALALFREAVTLGEIQSFVPAASLLDWGRGAPRDPGAAADLLLRGVASDNGEAFTELTERPGSWSPATIAAIQSHLHEVGFYDGEIDGVSGPKFAAALQLWRNGGYLVPNRP